MEHVQNFQNYLIQNGSSHPTVKNYLADIRKFIKFVERTHNTAFTPSHITKETVEAYKASLLAQNTSSSSIERYLSSMRKFTSYLTEKNILPLNPFLLKEEKESDEWELGGFKNLLHTQQVSPLTVKNYFLDIKQFLSWIEKVDTNLSKDNKISSLTPSVIDAYKSRLLSQAELSPVSVNRKLSSIRKYLSYLHQAGYLHTLPQVSNQQEEKTAQTTSEDINTLFPSYTDKAEIRENTQISEDYSSFAPVRVSQKSKKGLTALFDLIVITPLAALVNKGQLYFRKSQGKKGLFHTSEKNDFAFSKSLPKNEATEALHTFVTKDPKSLFKGISNISKSFYAPLSVSTADFPFHKKIWHHMRHTRPSWYQKYHSYPLTHYFHFAVLLIVIVVAGVGIYSALFDSGRKNPALAALPTAPPRILSFQGRLTDASDNPITTYKNVRFAIYDDSSATGSGNLLWQELLGVTPDQDGVFSVLLGNTVTTCANPLTIATAACAIPSTLFTENATLYLGVTIENDTELTPRQQVATVAYATNAETLQGLPPSTAGGAGTSNVVLALDSTGNLTIGGSATPTFQASGGQFTLSGSVLNLTTTSGSNSNVVLNPDGGGFIDVRKPFINSTLNTQLTTAAGAVTVGDLFAVNATSSGQSAFTLNQDGSGPLFTASASGTNRFVITNAGNVGIGSTLPIHTLDVVGTTRISSTLTLSTFSNNGGVLYTNGSGVVAQTTVGNSGECLQSAGGGAPTWASCLGTGASKWTITSGAIHPNNLTLDALIGGNSTASAKFGFINVAGGTPTATIAGNLSVAVPTGADPATTYSVFNGGSINFRTSVGGDSGASSRLFIANNGNIGIGSTSPLSRLDITSSATNTDVQRWMATDGSRLGRFTETSGGAGWFEVDNASGVAQVLLRGDGGNSYVLSGNFGVGTSNPGQELDVNGDILTGANSTIDVRAAGTLSIGGTTQTGLTLGRSGASTALVGNSSSSIDFGNFDVNATGEITAVANETINGIDISSGAVSDITTLATTGVVTFANYTTNGGLLYTNGSGVVAQTTAGGSGQCLQSIGGGAPTWGTCGSGSNWTVGSGAIYPNNSTLDLLVGGSATTSAKFGLINVTSGTPTATISGNLAIAVPTGSSPATTYSAFNGGSINFRTSVGGDSGASSRLFIANNGNIGINTTTASQLLHLSNTKDATIRLGSTTDSSSWTADTDTIGSLEFYGADASGGGAGVRSYIKNVVTATAGNLYRLEFGVSTNNNAATTAMSIQSDGNVGIGTTTPGAKLDVAGNLLVNNGGTIDTRAAGTLTIGGTTQTGVTVGRTGASTTLVGNSSSSIDFGNFDVTAAGLVTTADDVAVNGGDITTSTTGTFNLINTNATTVNIAGAASTALSLGNTSGTTSLLGVNVRLGDTSNGINITSAGIITDLNGNVTVQDHVVPQADATYDLGTTSLQWRNIYASGSICFAGGTDCATSFSSLGVNYWNLTSGTLQPKNSTLDLLIGGTATTSADFAFINVNSGTPTATISGNLALAVPTGSNPATTYSAFNGGSINFRTSVGGDAGATSRLFIANNGNIGIGSTSPTQALDLVGNFTLNGTSGILPTGAGAGITFSGSGNHDITASAGTLRIGAYSLTGSLNANSNTITNATSYNGLVITANTGVITTGTWQGTAVGAQYGGTGINTSSSTGVPYISSGTWSVDANALAANHGGTGQTGYTTGDLLYASSTTALSKLGIGSSGQALTVSGGLPAWANTNTSAFGLWDQASGVINPKNSTLDLLVGGSATTSAKFGLININSGTPTATLSGNLAIAAPTGSTPATSISVFNGGNLTFNTSVGGNGGSTGRMVIKNDGNIGIGTTTATDIDRKLTVTGTFFAGGATTGVQISGTTISSGFVNSAAQTDHDLTIRNTTLNGNLYLQTGGSTTRLAIDSVGTLTASAYTTNGGILYTNGSGVFSQTSAGSSGQCLQSNGGGAPTWITCATGSKWTITAGGIHPNNSTLDLFIGGTATASSKFAFINVNSGTPTFRAYNSTSSQYISLNHDGTNGNILASTGTINIGQGGGTLYLETDIQNDTTNNSGFVKISDKLLVQAGTEASANSLAIFDNTTAGADILTASSAGTTRFVLSGAGNVGIGTSLPRAALEVVGDASASGSLVLRNASSNQIESMNGSPLSFWTSVGGDAGLTERLRITSNGNVGINSTSPTSGYILDAVGRGRFSTGLSVGTTATTNVFELVGTMNQASGQVTFGGNVDATSGLDVTGSSLTVGGANFSVTTAGAITAAGDAAINGGDITTNQTTFNLVNATATSVNFAGGATGTLAIGNSSGTTNLLGANVRLGDTTNGINITSAGIITDLNGDVTVQDNLVPQANNTYDLGTASLQWQDYYGIGNAYSATFTDANNNSYYLDPASTTDSLLTLGSIRVGGGSSGTGGVTLEDNEQEGVAGTIPNGAGRNNLLATAGYLMSPFGGFGRYENFMRYSEQFDNQGYWARSGLSVVANAAQGPNSQDTALATADVISDDGTPNGTLTQSYPTTLTGGEVWTFSVWLRNVRAAESSYQAATGNVLLSLVSNGSGASAATTTIATPSTSWERYSVTYTVNGTSPTQLQAQINYQGGANTEVVVWGAQLEKQAAPSVYAQTTERVITTGRGLVATGVGPHLLQTGNGGTATPSASGLFLSASGGIQSTTVTPTKNLFELYNSDTSATNNVSSIGFLANRAGNVATQMASISAILTDATATAYTGALSFSTMSQAGTTPTEKLRIAGNGNVGIGSASPESLLEVQGAEGLDAILTLDADDGDDNADTWFIESEAADNDLSFVNHTSEVFKITSAGDITMTGTTLTASSLTTFTSAATLAFSGDIRVNGNDLLDSGGTSRIQLGSTITFGGVTTFTASSLTTFTTGATLAFSGDLRINGNDLQDSAGTTRLTLGATNVLTGDLNVTGQDIQLNGTTRISDSVSASYTDISPQNANLIVYDGVNNQNFRVYNSGGSSAVRIHQNGTTYGLIETEGTTNHLVVNATGNIGVNNTTPDRKFSVVTDVSGGSGISFINQTTTDAGTGVILVGVGVAASGTNTARWMKFYSSCTDDTYSGCTGKANISLNGTGNAQFLGTGADFGEYVDMGEQVEYGEIISYSNNKGVKATTHMPILGVTSNNPGFVGNARENDVEVTNSNRKVVGFLGQVKTKVSTSNGLIKKGDRISASDIPGVGQKATSLGSIVGIALEDFDSSQGEVCSQGASGATCGQIMVYVNPSWYDPDVYITNAGDLNVSFENDQYVARNAGTLVSRIGSFATAVIANIRAGAIQAQTLAVSGASTFGSVTANSLSLATSNITIAGQSLTAFIDSRIQTAIDSGNFVTPLASDSATVKAGKIIVKAPVATEEPILEVQGNASISGQLATETLVTTDATVSGTLTVDTLIADNLTALEAQVASLSAGQTVAIATPSAESIASLISTGIQSNYADIASLSAGMAFVPDLKTDFLQVNQGLIALAPSSLSDTSITGQLSINGSLILSENSVNVLGADFNIQPLRQGGVSFQGGLITMDTEGNLYTAGNAAFAKDVTIGGKLATNFISPLPGNNLELTLPATATQLANGTGSSLVVKNASGSGILAINQLGDLVASGAGQFKELAASSLNIVRGAQADTSFNETVASGSAGTGSITAYYTERTITTPFVTEDSLIYITPTSNTSGITPYVSRQVAKDEENGIEGSFTVTIPQATTSDIKFNWWIVN